MTRFCLLAAVSLQACFSANLAVSAYFRDNFTPTAIASDLQGNVLVAGSAVTDPVALTGGAVVAKLNPQASEYIYFTYLDGAASDAITAIAVDGAGNAYVAGYTTNPNFPVLGGGSLGTAPTGISPQGVADQRSFIIKLSPMALFSFPR